MSDDELFDECPLCAEEVDISDLNFKPCACGYQICTFCFEKICNGDNRCPACRRGYPDEQVAYAPATPKQIAKYKAFKLVKDGIVASPDLGDRKHLSNTRIEQKNLVYVLGFPMKYNDSELLRHHDYFGQFGVITKLQISPRARSAGQPASFAVHVTYSHTDEAKRAISALEGLEIEGRAIKATYGMNKYCANFLKFIPCHSPNCLFLHEEVKDNDDSQYSYAGQYRKPGFKSISGPPAPLKRSDTRGFGRLKDKDLKGSALPATASWAKTSTSGSDLNDGLHSTVSDFPTLSSHIEVALRSPSKSTKRRGRAPLNPKESYEPGQSSTPVKRESSPVLAQDPFEDLSLPDNLGQEAPVHSQPDFDLPDPLSSSDLVYSSGEEHGFSEEFSNAKSNDVHKQDLNPNSDENNILSDGDSDKRVPSVNDSESKFQPQSHNPDSYGLSIPSSYPSLLHNSEISNDYSSVENLNDRLFSSQEGHGINLLTPVSASSGINNHNMDTNFLNRQAELASMRSTLNHLSNLNSQASLPLNHVPKSSEPLYPNLFMDPKNGFMNSNASHIPSSRAPYLNHMDFPGSSRAPISKAGPQKSVSSGSRFQFAQLPPQGMPQNPILPSRPEIANYKLSSDAVNFPSRSNSGNYPPGITPHWSPEEVAQNVLGSFDSEVQPSNIINEDTRISSPFDSFSSNGGIEVQLKDLFLADLQKRGKSTAVLNSFAPEPLVVSTALGSDFEKHPPGVFPPPLAYSLDPKTLPIRQTRLPSFENPNKHPHLPFSNGTLPFLQGSGFNPLLQAGMVPPSSHEDMMSSRSRQSSVGLIPKQLPPRQKEGSRFFNRPTPPISNFLPDVNPSKNRTSPTSHDIPQASLANSFVSLGYENNGLSTRLADRSILLGNQYDEPSSVYFSNELSSPNKKSFSAGPTATLPGVPGNQNTVPQLTAQALSSSNLQQSSFRPNPHTVSQGLSNNHLSSFPNVPQGVYNVNAHTSYPGFSQGPFNGFQGLSQNQLHASLIENNQPNLSGNQSVPFFNSRNFGSIQSDLRNPNFFPPNLGVTGFPSPFSGQAQDTSGWSGPLGSHAGLRSQPTSVATEFRHTPSHPFPLTSFMAHPGHPLASSKPAFPPSDIQPSVICQLSREDEDKTSNVNDERIVVTADNLLNSSSYKENIKADAKSDSVINHGHSSKDETKLFYKPEVSVDPMPLGGYEKINGGVQNKSRSSLINQTINPGDSDSAHDPLVDTSSILASEPASDKVILSHEVLDTKASKIVPINPDSVNPKAISEIVPPPPSKHYVDLKSSSAEAPTSDAEVSYDIPVFSLDFLKVPKVLPKQLNNKIPDEFLNDIYKDLRSTNLIMQKALVESSLKKSKKAKKACKAFASSINKENPQVPDRNNAARIISKEDVCDESAVLANKSLKSELLQAQDELEDLSKLIRFVSSSSNFKFDINFNL